MTTSRTILADLSAYGAVVVRGGEREGGRPVVAAVDPHHPPPFMAEASEQWRLRSLGFDLIGGQWIWQDGLALTDDGEWVQRFKQNAFSRTAFGAQFPQVVFASTRDAGTVQSVPETVRWLSQAVAVAEAAKNARTTEEHQAVVLQVETLSGLLRDGVPEAVPAMARIVEGLDVGDADAVAHGGMVLEALVVNTGRRLMLTVSEIDALRRGRLEGDLPPLFTPDAGRTGEPPADAGAEDPAWPETQEAEATVPTDTGDLDAQRSAWLNRVSESLAVMRAVFDAVGGMSADGGVLDDDRLDIARRAAVAFRAKMEAGDPELVEWAKTIESAVNAPTPEEAIDILQVAGASVDEVMQQVILDAGEREAYYGEVATLGDHMIAERFAALIGETHPPFSAPATPGELEPFAQGVVEAPPAPPPSPYAFVIEGWDDVLPRAGTTGGEIVSVAREANRPPAPEAERLAPTAARGRFDFAIDGLEDVSQEAVLHQPETAPADASGGRTAVGDSGVAGAGVGDAGTDHAEGEEGMEAAAPPLSVPPPRKDMGEVRPVVAVTPVPAAEDRASNDGQIGYTSLSKIGVPTSMSPRNLDAATREALGRLAAVLKAEGYEGVDDYVAKRLGLEIADLAPRFTPEQVDAIGLGLHNGDDGNGTVLADEMGLGKTRVLVAMMWAKALDGGKSVFLTQRPVNLDDLWSEAKAIGADRVLKPFVVASPDNAPQHVLYPAMERAALEETLARRGADGRWVWPSGHNVVLSTYSQFQRKKDHVLSAWLREAVGPDDALLLDEGQSIGADGKGVGRVNIIAASESAGQVVISAAAVLKSGEMAANLAPVLKSVVGKEELDGILAAVARGGETELEFLSLALVRAGLLIHREHDRANLTLRAVHDTTRDLHYQEASDAFSATMLAMLRNKFVNGEEVALIQSYFTAAMKTGFIVDEAVRAHAAGRKPVIAFQTTSEGVIKGDNPMPTFADYLRAKALAKVEAKVRTLRDEDDKEKEWEAYRAILPLIDAIPANVPANLIDTVKHGLARHGIRCGELSGRAREAVALPNGSVKLRSRGRDDGSEIFRFNGGRSSALLPERDRLDAMVMSTGTGAVGVSLHASAAFGDQRPRTILEAQFGNRVADAFNLPGRVNRLGQVEKPEMVILGSGLPIEHRQIASLMAKFHRVSAFSAGSREAKAHGGEVPDVVNWVGNEAARSFLDANPELADRLGLLEREVSDGEDMANAQSTDDRSDAGSLANSLMQRMGFLPVAEQTEAFEAFFETFEVYLAELDRRGENPLRAREVPGVATLVDRAIYDGSGDPGKSVFAEDTYLDTYEVTRPRHPKPVEWVAEKVAASSPNTVSLRLGDVIPKINAVLAKSDPVKAKDVADKAQTAALKTREQILAARLLEMKRAIPGGRDQTRDPVQHCHLHIAGFDPTVGGQVLPAGHAAENDPVYLAYRAFEDRMSVIRSLAPGKTVPAEDFDGVLREAVILAVRAPAVDKAAYRAENWTVRIMLPGGEDPEDVPLSAVMAGAGEHFRIGDSWEAASIDIDGERVPSVHERFQQSHDGLAAYRISMLSGNYTKAMALAGSGRNRMAYPASVQLDDGTTRRGLVVRKDKEHLLVRGACMVPKGGVATAIVRERGAALHTLPSEVSTPVVFEDKATASRAARAAARGKEPDAGSPLPNSFALATNPAKAGTFIFKHPVMQERAKGNSKRMGVKLRLAAGLAAAVDDERATGGGVRAKACDRLLELLTPSKLDAFFDGGVQKILKERSIHMRERNIRPAFDRALEQVARLGDGGRSPEVVAAVEAAREDLFRAVHGYWTEQRSRGYLMVGWPEPRRDEIRINPTLVSKPTDQVVLNAAQMREAVKCIETLGISWNASAAERTWVNEWLASQHDRILTVISPADEYFGAAGDLGVVRRQAEEKFPLFRDLIAQTPALKYAVDAGFHYRQQAERKKAGLEVGDIPEIYRDRPSLEDALAERLGLSVQMVRAVGAVGAMASKVGVKIDAHGRTPEEVASALRVLDGTGNPALLNWLPGRTPDTFDNGTKSLRPEAFSSSWKAFLASAEHVASLSVATGQPAADLLQGARGEWPAFHRALARAWTLDDDWQRLVVDAGAAPEDIEAMRRGAGAASVNHARLMASDLAHKVILPVAAHMAEQKVGIGANHGFRGADGEAKFAALQAAAYRTAQEILFEGKGAKTVTEMASRFALDQAHIAEKVQYRVRDNWAALCPEIQAPNGVWLTPLTSSDSLRNEGSAQGAAHPRSFYDQGKRAFETTQGNQHCVGGYADQCKRGETHIHSAWAWCRHDADGKVVRDAQGNPEIVPSVPHATMLVAGQPVAVRTPETPADVAPVRLSTLEIRLGKAGEVSVAQNYSRGNSTPCPAALAATDYLVRGLTDKAIPIDHDGIKRGRDMFFARSGGDPVFTYCGFPWRDRQSLATSINAFTAYLPEDLRRGGLDGLAAKCKDVIDIAAGDLPEVPNLVGVAVGIARGTRDRYQVGAVGARPI